MLKIAIASSVNTDSHRMESSGSDALDSCGVIHGANALLEEAWAKGGTWADCLSLIHRLNRCHLKHWLFQTLKLSSETRPLFASLQRRYTLFIQLTSLPHARVS